MNIEEFRNLVNIKDVIYNKEKEYVDFGYNVHLTFNLIEKTKTFFGFDNYIIYDNIIFKIPKIEILCAIENIIPGKCDFDFPRRTITLEYEITDVEIKQIKELLQCKSLIISGGQKLRLKWSN
jgi:hypothetical protein